MEITTPDHRMIENSTKRRSDQVSAESSRRTEILSKHVDFDLLESSLSSDVRAVRRVQASVGPIFESCSH